MRHKGSLSQPAACQIVTVLGGSGFLGRYVVRALANRGYRVRIAVRRPDLAGSLQPLGNVGQVVAVQANMRDRESIANAVQGASAVVNLTGILRPKGKQTFEAVHAGGAGLVAELTSPEARLIHVSAIGAATQSPSIYARSKAAGEAAVLAARPDAVIIRPSVIFGPGDGFFNRLAAVARILPVMPVLCASTRVQPVFAGDVAEVIARAVDGEVEGGRVYELGGPAVATMRDISVDVLKAVERKKPIVAIPSAVASFNAFWLEFWDKVTFGLVLPQNLVFTRDQVALLKTDNVVSSEAENEGRTLKGLGIEPVAYDGLLPSYLVRFRKVGEFENVRERAYSGKR